MRNFWILQGNKVPPPKAAGTAPIREILYKLLNYISAPENFSAEGKRGPPSEGLQGGCRVWGSGGRAPRTLEKYSKIFLEITENLAIV